MMAPNLPKNVLEKYFYLNKKGALREPKNAPKMHQKRPKHENLGALNQVLFFVLIMTILLYFKMISFWFNI